MLKRSLWIGGLSVLGALACDGPGGGRDAGSGNSGINITVTAGATETADADDDDDAANDDRGGGDGETGQSTSSTGADDSGDDGGDGPKFDLPTPDAGTDRPGCEELGNCECTIPEHVPCDAGTSDPFHAMGLNCPGELEVNDSSSGPGTAIGIRTSFGGTATFDPREGSVYAVLGSGLVAELDMATPPGDSNAGPTYCNDDLGAYDPGAALPAPLKTNNVAGDCTTDAALLGTGDCSNTIEDQFSQGFAANDYVELRFDVQVPPDVVSFSYDFAFMSTEYPYYFGSSFNDMYIGWLESEQWTGNISFDAAGNPISLNAGFLEYADDPGNLPELAGTCMRQHAATGWLTTTTGVTPGEMITVVFAVFDLSDSILDSYVFLDNFEWGCDPTRGPVTEPEG